MRIDFSRKMQGKALEPFLYFDGSEDLTSRWVDPELKRIYRVKENDFSYALIGNLNQGLNDKGLLSKVTASNALWVGGDDPFSLSFTFRSPYTCDYIREQVELKERKGWFGTREYPVITSKPLVNITGEVVFDRFYKNNPEPVLDVLNQQGYNSRVIPNSEDIERMIKKIKEIRSAKLASNKNRDYREERDDSGLVALALAFGLGMWID